LDANLTLGGPFHDQLAQNIDDLHHAVQSSLEEKLIALTCDGQATIFVDEMLFRRVINNILANAIKCSQASGLIYA
jgi:signal transduction histidine kinase